MRLQAAGDVSHKANSKLLLLYARGYLPATEHRRLWPLPIYNAW